MFRLAPWRKNCKTYPIQNICICLTDHAMPPSPRRDFLVGHLAEKMPNTSIELQTTSLHIRPAITEAAPFRTQIFPLATWREKC
jgi:hypothetical protein